MQAILRSTTCMPLSSISDRHASSPSEVGMFVVDDRTGLIAARASVRFDVCPVTKTIVGFKLAFDPAPSRRPATVVARKRPRKKGTAGGDPGAWPMPAMPRTVVIDCPEFDAPTFRDAIMKLKETEPDRES